MRASAHHVSGAQAGQQPTLLISPALDDVAGEQQVDPVKGLDLEALAAATGGAYTDPELLTAGTFTSTTALGPTQDAGASLSAVRLWPVLLLLGLLLYLAEITYRRWPSASTEGN